MNAYEQKLKDRAERYAARAAKLAQLSDAAYRSARGEVEHIPFGQPILVGHHSERRHRRAIERYDQRMRKSVEADAKAKYYAQRAESVGSAGISSDDPDAVMKLEKKLEGLKRSQELMKSANAVIRKHKDDEKRIEALIKLGFRESTARQAVKPDFMGRVGFPSYSLQNNNANIKRVEDRIKVLTRIAQNQAVSAPKSLEWVIEGAECTVKENFEENRLQVFFNGKPAEAVRSAMKSAGFRWAPSAGAWQRFLHTANIELVKMRLKAQSVA